MEKEMNREIEELKKIELENIEKLYDRSGNLKYNEELENYFLWIVYQIYKETDHVKLKAIKYRNKEEHNVLKGSKGKVVITIGMREFYNVWLSERIYGLPKYLLDEIAELNSKIKELERRKKENSKAEESHEDIAISKEIEAERKKLEEKKELRNKKISKSEGLMYILVRSSNIKVFWKIINQSMWQAYYKLPSDNKILDREYQKLKDILKNSESFQDRSSGIAANKAKLEEGVDFEYIGAGINSYYTTTHEGNIATVEEENINALVDTQKRIEEDENIFRRPIDPNAIEKWRPYSGASLVRILKLTAEEFGGKVYMRDLKALLGKLLEEANTDHSYIAKEERGTRDGQKLPPTREVLQADIKKAESDPYEDHLAVSLDDFQYSENAIYDQAIDNFIYKNFLVKEGKNKSINPDFIKFINKLQENIKKNEDIEKVSLSSEGVLENMREYSDFIDMLKEFMLSLNEPEYFDISLDLLILSKLVEVTNDPKKW